MTGSTIVHASLLGLFVGGYLTTCDHFRGVPVEFLALTLIGVTLSLWTLAVLIHFRRISRLLLPQILPDS